MGQAEREPGPEQGAAGGLSFALQLTGFDAYTTNISIKRLPFILGICPT